MFTLKIRFCIWLMLLLSCPFIAAYEAVHFFLSQVELKRRADFKLMFLAKWICSFGLNSHKNVLFAAHWIGGCQIQHSFLIIYSNSSYKSKEMLVALLLCIRQIFFRKVGSSSIRFCRTLFYFYWLQTMKNCSLWSFFLNWRNK